MGVGAVTAVAMACPRRWLAIHSSFFFGDGSKHDWVGGERFCQDLGQGWAES